LKHILQGHKLFFRYVLFNLSHVYLSHDQHGSKNVSVVISKNIFYYLAVHFRFSSVFYSSQLVDLFSYELPISTAINSSQSVDNVFTSNSVLVYNFHNLTTHDRFFVFCVEAVSVYDRFSINSVAELYPNASWLEREVSELHGITFNNKKDLRNLMLQYGDTSTPFRKSSPSIGVKEVCYDSVNDILIQIPVSIQV